MKTPLNKKILLFKHRTRNHLKEIKREISIVNGEMRFTLIRNSDNVKEMFSLLLKIPRFSSYSALLWHHDGVI